MTIQSKPRSQKRTLKKTKLDAPKRLRKTNVSDEKVASNATKEYCTIKVKLETMLAPFLDEKFREKFRDVIEKCVANLSKIALEGSLLVCLHVLRCVRDKRPFPKLDHTFFDRCYKGVTDTTYVSLDLDLNVTIDYFKTLRPVHDYQVAQNEHMSMLISNLSLQMMTCAHNHIELNFGRRLIRYVRLKYELKTNKDAEKFISGAFAVKDDDKTEKQLEFQAWLVYNPFYDNLLREHTNHFLAKLYDMLSFMESLPADTKGKRTFTILPLKAGFHYSHVIIHRSNLQQVLQLLTEDCRRRLVKRVFEEMHDEEACAILQERLGNPEVNFNLEMFQNVLIADKIWDLLIDAKRYETVNRKFAYGITTNGYEVCLRFQKPKKDGGGGDGDGEDPTFDPTPTNWDAFDSFVGVDPGVTFIVTAYSGEVDPVTGKSQTLQVSSKEYRHNAEMTSECKWKKNLRKRDHDYDEMCENMPCFKTCDFDGFATKIKYVLEHSDKMFRVYSQRPFRKWRFKTFVYGQKALVDISKRLTAGGKNVCIGFGDWSQQDGVIKGHAKAPLKKLRRELRKHATVIAIDEYRTSLTCSVCLELKNVVNMKYNKVNKTSEKKVLERSHQVVRCQSESCSTCWQRDSNAARNMYTLLMRKKNGEERPVALQRPSRVVLPQEIANNIVTEAVAPIGAPNVTMLASSGD